MLFVRFPSASHGRPIPNAPSGYTTVACGYSERMNAAQLRHVDDRAPGFRRRRKDGGFIYFDLQNRRIRRHDVLQRIKMLAIPPAYEDVWICPLPEGHLQATGRDARGRKQYRYHKRWREVRDEAKYRRTIDFARALPGLRASLEKDLAAPGMTKEKVLATVVRLLDTTFARIGNESYAKDNGSYGLTTLRRRHVDARNGKLRLRFRGKSGIEHTIAVSDRRLASIIRRCRDLPGQELFTYVTPDDDVAPVASDDVNAYLQAAMGSDFSAKDFRTWHGTVLCAIELAETPCPGSQRERRQVASLALKAVASRLRNTPAVVRQCYVHPAVLDRFMLDGRIVLPRMAQAKGRTSKGLNADEARVLRFLEREARRDERAELRRALRRSVTKAKTKAAA